MKPRNVCVVTGTRAEYGALRPVMQAIDTAPQLHLKVCATGMHLLAKFGSTVRQVDGDGWGEVFRVRMQAPRDSQDQQALGLGRGVAGMAKQFEIRNTHIVVVLGDRIEAIEAFRVEHGGQLIGVAQGTRGRVTTVMAEHGLVDVVWDNGEIDVVLLGEIRAISAVERLGDLVREGGGFGEW